MKCRRTKLGIIAHSVLASGFAHAGQSLELNHSANEDLEAELVGSGELRPERVALEIDGRRWVTPWRLASSSPYAGPISIVVLVQGTEMWMGNDDSIICDGPETPGALKELRTRLDHANFTVPPTTARQMGVYGSKLRWLEPDRIDGSALRTQASYQGEEETALTTALRGGLQWLARRPAGRRILVAIGDGCDDATDQQRDDLRTNLAAEHIELEVIVYKAPSSCFGAPIRQVTPNLVWVTSVEAITSALHAIFQRAHDRVFARFDATALPWDGEVHQYDVISNGVRYGPVFRSLPDRREHRWGWWVSACGVVVALIAVLLVIRRAHRSATANLR
jgi:hypothetical protein